MNREMKKLSLALIGLLCSGPLPAAESRSYLFSYFVGNGEDGLHLAWSTNGYNWDSLNHGRSLLTPVVGESKLMRDPSLLQAPDNKEFHLVWTTAWKGKTIGYAHSKDLVHWSEQKAVPVMADQSGAENCWAPELFYDKAKRQYLIFWASTVKHPGSTNGESGHRLYYVTTRDFQTFAPARSFFDPGFSVIDGTMVEHGGRFYLIFKDERERPAPRKDLRLAQSTSAEGPWEQVSEPFTRTWVEGPTPLQIGDETFVYFDCYRDKHYGALKSEDLQHWEDVTSRLSMPSGIRHGTALEVSAEILKALRAAQP